MRKRNLLFVTYQNDHSEEGLSYAMDLARTLDKGLVLLLLKERKGLSESFSDMMSAVAFAEEGEHETAREMLAGGGKAVADVDEKAARLVRKCGMSGIDAAIRASDTDTVSAVRDTLRDINTIDMVLLGPGATEDGKVSAKELNRLIKSATMPVVTITRHACAA